jgi:hypothetical protein
MSNGMLARANRRAIAPKVASPGATNDPDRADRATHAEINAPGILSLPKARGVVLKLAVFAVFKPRLHNPGSRAASANALSMRFKSPDAMWSAPEQHMLQS